MLRSLFSRVSLLIMFVGVSQGRAFSLLGPYAIKGGTVWQVQRLGYNLPGDIGGPMNVAAGEEYRWNVKNVYYTYDRAFLDFFGTRGLQEVEKAIQILNNLPPASALNVDDYPMTTERINYQAGALGLIDLKSVALGVTLEEMGLADSERWVFCLRNRYVPGPGPFPVFYTVIRRNFDPVTAAESPYINGRLWTYTDIIQLDPVRAWSYTFNSPVDPLDFGRFDPVATVGGQFSGFGYGSFFTGLTRDDAAAIKYMLRPDNRNFEAALPGSTNAGFTFTGGGGGGPWTIPTTNVVVPPGTVAANGLIDPAYRSGVDKLNFVRVDPSAFDPLTGTFFVPISDVYTETVMTNGVAVQQSVQRVVIAPDILYTAADLNLAAEPGLIPGNFWARTVTDPWPNNGTVLHAGPGVIVPTIQITFNNVGFITIEEALSSDEVFNVFGVNAFPIFIYGAFDGTTNAPVIFSQGGNITIQQLEQLALGGIP